MREQISDKTAFKASIISISKPDFLRWLSAILQKQYASRRAVWREAHHLND